MYNEPAREKIMYKKSCKIHSDMLRIGKTGFARRRRAKQKILRLGISNAPKARCGRFF